jgi:hypothetical protein
VVLRAQGHYRVFRGVDLLCLVFCGGAVGGVVAADGVDATTVYSVTVSVPLTLGQGLGEALAAAGLTNAVQSRTGWMGT